jgi:hypothetical protein
MIAGCSEILRGQKPEAIRKIIENLEQKQRYSTEKEDWKFQYLLRF